MIFFILFPLSYLIGSIPTGYWFTKFIYGIDITRHGSGNIGATNIGRVLKSKKLFALIFVIDALKAYFVLFASDNLATYLNNPLTYKEVLFLGALVLIGNGYSIFMGFKGGKGVATAIGVMTFVCQAWLGVFLALALPLLIITKRVDVSMLTGLSLLILFYMILYPRFGTLELLFFLLFLVGWILYRHKDNLKRFKEGREL